MADMDNYYLNHANEEARKAELLLRGIIVKHHIDNDNGMIMDEVALAKAVEKAEALIADYQLYKGMVEMSNYYAQQVSDYKEEQ